MSDVALATLKANKNEVTNKLIENPNSSDWLSEFVGDDLYVTKKYEIEDFILKVPSNEKDRETDIYNSIILYEKLNKLPLHVLTDERFWLF